MPRRGTIPQPAEAMVVFAPLFFAFGLILLIGCANVANLLLARAVSRQREIGIRLSLGASRRRIIRQLLTESLLLSLASAAAGFVISRVVLAATIRALMTSMPPDLGDVRVSVPGADWRVALFLVIGAVVSTALYGLVPARQATRVEPIRAIRNEVMRDARPRRARNLLIGLQVSASALLLICSGVFLRSALSSATVDPGLRTADTVIVEIVNEPTRRAMVQAITTEPSVAAVAASWPDMLAPPRAAFAEAGGRKLAVAYKFASPEYFSVLDIPVLRGRGFTVAERAANAAVAVVTEAAARDLWPRSGAVGQVLQLDADPSSQRGDAPPLRARTFTVVGVIRDVPGFRLAGFKEAGVYVPIDAATPGTSLIVRVHGDPELARRMLLEHLTAIDPNMGQVVTMRTVAGMETYFLQMGFWLTLALGGLALVLTLSGLFSVLSYLVEQRGKEIGVRMALGATTANVVQMVLSQSVRPVGAGLLVGGGIAGGLAIVLLATPAASSIGAIVHVFDPVAYVGSVVCIATACALAASIPAWRAARIDPVNTLRQD